MNHFHKLSSIAQVPSVPLSDKVQRFTPTTFRKAIPLGHSKILIEVDLNLSLFIANIYRKCCKAKLCSIVRIFLSEYK